MHAKCIFLLKNFVSSKKSSTFATAFEKEQTTGAVVQLVRIPACHAVGREFESRPHRRKHPLGCFFVFVGLEIYNFPDGCV